MLTYISRIGGKSRIRKRIVAMFPEDYTTYIEPFLGGGQVFLELEQRDNVLHVLNDNHKDIYDLWNDLREVDAATIKAFDFSHQSKERFWEMKRATGLEGADRLYRNLYISLFSYSYDRKHFAPKAAGKGNHIKKNVDALKKKLEGVVLTCQDYKDVIARYDDPNAILYLDPPYPKMEKYYEGQGVCPKELAAVCKGIKGRFILSYDGEGVEEAFKDFYKTSMDFCYTSGRGTKRKQEFLFSNFKIE